MQEYFSANQNTNTSILDQATLIPALRFKRNGPGCFGRSVERWPSLHYRLSNGHLHGVVMPRLNLPTAIEAAPEQRPHATDSRRKWKPWLCGGGICFMVLAAIAIYFIVTYWPYRHRVVDPQLSDVFGSEVKFSQYHRTYFPDPGFVASGITLRRKSAPDQPPFGSVQKVVVRGRWSDLFMLRKRVEMVEVSGLHVVVPPPGSRANREEFPSGSLTDFEGPDILIDYCVFRDAVLDIMSPNGHRTSFRFHRLQIRNLQKGRVLTYDVDMENAIPTGRIQAWGTFGPLNAKNFGATPVTGHFSFSSIQLDQIGELKGTMASKGQFKGPLAAIQAEASSETPDFAISDGTRSPVSGWVKCMVNGLNGDVILQQVEARSGETIVHSSGSVKGDAKVANIDFKVAAGRAQDVLRPFVSSRVPITGPVSLHGHAYVGPSKPGVAFLKRLRVDGAFDVPAERVTNSSTQKSLTAFSQRASGQDKSHLKEARSGSDADQSTDVLSSFEGPVTIRNGIANSDRLTFRVVGAEANLRGTFNFNNEAVHLTGDLKMKTDISHVTTGFKSALLKPFAPFFKKKEAGAVVPIAVTGSPGHYRVTQNLSHKK